MNIHQTTSLLAGLSPAQFMQRHWQKKPLVVRGAVDLSEISLTREALFKAAAKEDIQSRQIQRKGKNWEVRQGPFDDSQPLPQLKSKTSQPWTVLVQGMNLHSAAMQNLLKKFRFVPDARLDDVMVSYATCGGGVGPHIDSYDVFLLQLSGVRQWRIAPTRSARERELIEGLPLKILKHFSPKQEFDLGPGDMLYLPPGYAHDGVAMDDECITASVGFRAPRAGELAASLLEQLADVVGRAEQGAFASLYQDADQAACNAPSRIPESLTDFLQNAWQRIQPTRDDFEQVVGTYLSEPKPHVMFSPIKNSAAALKKAGQRGIILSAATQMLYGKRALYMNGDVFMWRDMSAASVKWLKRLADERQAESQHIREMPGEAHELVEEWLLAGYLLSK